MASPFWTIATELEIDAILAKLFSFTETKRDSHYGPYGYVGASRVDKATHDAVMMAHYLAGQPFVITQGGLNNFHAQRSGCDGHGSHQHDHG
jgi:hypothetical protein